jgi:hypothetical protein
MKSLRSVRRPILAALAAALTLAGSPMSPAAAASRDRVGRLNVAGHGLGTTREVDEAEPNDSTAAAQDVGEPDVSVNSSIFFIDIGDAPCDEPGGCEMGPDYYAFTIGVTSEVSIFGPQSDASFTYSGTLYGASGSPIATMADGELHETLEPGRYVFGNSAEATDPTLGGIVFNILILATPEDVGPSDVALVVSSVDGPAVSGAQLSLSATAVNAGNRAASATVTTSVPAGTTLASAVTTRGSLSAPAAGGNGPITLAVTLGPGEQATVSLVLNVTASPGETLSATASVEVSSGDTNPSNNTVSGAVTVVQGPGIRLSFTPPADGGLAPPTGLTATPADDSGEGFTSGGPAAPGQPIGYRVYRSPQPDVQATPGNLLVQLEAGVTSVVTSASAAGTHFVVTAVYSDGESAPSNEVAAVVAGPRVDAVTVSAKKVTATGSFTGAPRVFVNGLAFSASPVIKRAGAKLIQRGALANGAPLSSVARPGSMVVVSIQGGDGGVTLVTARVR